MKRVKYIIVLALLTFVHFGTFAQKTDANIFGDVQSLGEHVPFVNIYLEENGKGTTTDITGHYMLVNLPEGSFTLVASAIGYTTVKKTVAITAGKTQEVNFVLEEVTMALDEVVVTGTKTFKRQTESPVIVNVLDSKALDNVQACNISEGLRFQPGLRVETDCQTCNYTQLRMNGLGGGYSQILINGRPIFSPLTGLYGMEQIPANMVDRIEVVRGGGSALYGSSAVGGTVNIITRIPSESSYDLSATTYNINGGAADNILSGNIGMLTHKGNAGAAIFVNRRIREAYDHNGDNFSELPRLENNSFGANMFFKPTYNQKLELNFSSLREYRYGGEMVDDAAYLAQQSEERTHDVFMGGLDYQINFNEENSSFIAYFAGQNTGRRHYTGIMPDEADDILLHTLNPPYGTTKNTTLQAGTQLNHKLENFLSGENVLTAGAEYVFDDVFDTIPAYDYEIDQVTRNIAGFIQSDWRLSTNITFLAGLRVDKHNLVDHAIFSPRVSLLYRLKNYMQFRLTWGTGFRAPQAFDADMHIAFAAGGVSRISLAPGLKEERSNSFSGSVNYDKATSNFIAGFTLEGFYTKLNDSCYLQPIGEYELGQHIEGLPPRKEFMRTPNTYGYLTFSFTPGKKFNASISSVYTGPMELVHYAGAPEQTVDEYKTSTAFTELDFKLGYTFIVESLDSGIEIFGGVKNITNAYQDDFDTGKNRDSNYVYGPSLPRTIYVGLRLKSF